MNLFFYYLMQVICCSSILLLYYWLVLRNKQFHTFNRFYLLSVAVISWLIPLLSLPLYNWISAKNSINHFVNIMTSGSQRIELTVHANTPSFNYVGLVFSIYLVVSILLCIQLGISIWRIYRLKQQNTAIAYDGCKIYLTNIQGTPFSFFKIIFWNISVPFTAASSKELLAHEKVHVVQLHSADKLFMQIILIIGWVNPIFWILRNELSLVHEFIADEKVIEPGDGASLAHMLLNAVFPAHNHILMNHFNSSPIKRRLQMLIKNQKNRFVFLRKMSVIPLLAIIFLLFSFTKQNVRVLNHQSNFFSQPLQPKDLPKVHSIQTNEIFDKEKPEEKDKIGGLQINIDTLQPLQEKHDNEKMNNPLYILNGEIISDNILKAIDKNKIRSINVLKNKLAIEKYGSKGKNGVIEIFTDNQTPTDATTQNNQLKGNIIFTQAETPAKFRGGVEAWIEFLQKNLNTDIPLMNKAPEGKYIVVLLINFDKNGKIVDVMIKKDPGYGTGAEALRVVELSPDWSPAMQNGIPVNCKQEQPITFVVAN